MELDDLKQAWQRSPVSKPTNTDIMDIIKHKSYGPLAALKQVYKKQIIMMAILPLVFILTNMDNVYGVFTSVLFWSYVAFCIGVIAFALYNYRIVRKMEIMNDQVKLNLEHQIELLERRARTELYIFRGVLIYFVIMLEVVPYFQHYRSLMLWHATPVWIRIACYAGLATLQYFMNRRIKEHKVGRHLKYLRSLVKEMA